MRPLLILDHVFTSMKYNSAPHDRTGDQAAAISRKLVLIVWNWFEPQTDKEIVHKKIIVTHGTDMSALIKDRYDWLKLCSCKSLSLSMRA